VLQSLLNLFAGIAVAVSIAAIIIGIILRTRGDPRANNVMLYGFVGLLIALLGWPLVRWIYSGYAISAPLGVPANVWSVVVYALSAIMVVASAIYIALGRVEEGAWSFIAAVAVVGLLGAGLTLFTQAAPAGTLRIEVVGNTVVSSGQDLVLVVRVPDAVKPVAINVSWGDGAGETLQVEPGAWARLVHRYSVGDAPAANYTVVLLARESETNRTGANVVGVIVVNPGYCPLGWPLNMLCGFLQRLSSVPLIGAAFSFDFQKLVMSPMFPTDPGDPVYGVYAMLFQASLIGVGLFIAFSIAWSTIVGESPRAVIASVKDSVIALVLALLAPHIYNATASIINTVSVGIVGQGYAVQAMAVGIYAIAIALGAALGLFLPYLAHLAATATILMLIGNIILVIRWALILAIVAASPLLALAYIHPALRGAARGVVGVLAGLVLAGPIAAIALIVIGKMVGDIAAAIAFPIFVQIAPSLLGAFGGSVAVDLGGEVLGGLRRVGGAITAAHMATQRLGRVGERMKISMQTPRAPAARTGGAGLGAGRAVYRPVITLSDVRRAAEEARLKKQALEGIATLPEGIGTFFAGAEAEKVAAERAWRKMDEFARGVLTDRRLQEAVGPAAVESARAQLEELVERERQKALIDAPRPERVRVRPGLEAFKAAAKELWGKASRQYWLNAKAGLKDFANAVMRELNVRVPKKAGRGEVKEAKRFFPPSQRPRLSTGADSSSGGQERGNRI
jgi:carbon starvation protein